MTGKAPYANYLNSIQKVSNIAKLHYHDSDGNLLPLPGWAKFFIDIGTHAACPLSQPDEKLVIGLALPTRSFASVFAAVGAVIGRFGISDGQKTCEEHFANLCTLPVNTPVKIRRKDKEGKLRHLDGVVLGTPTIHGQTTLKIQVTKATMNDPSATGATYFIQGSQAWDVSIPNTADRGSVESLPTKLKGKLVARTSEFARSIVGDPSVLRFESESEMTCLIVGTKSVLKRELTEQKFFAGSSVEGSLSELLRIKRLLTPGSHYRSNYFATNSRRPPRYNDDLVPSLVIFDGAQGFLKWRDYFPSSNWLVLLDVSSPNFEPGRDVLNGHYFQRSDTAPSLELIPMLPDGIEMVIFQEKR